MQTALCLVGEEDTDGNDAIAAPPKTKAVPAERAAAGSGGDDSPAADARPAAKAKNYEFLKAMGTIKGEIGEANYYKIMGDEGFEHADHIVDRKDQIRVFNRMKQAKEEIANFAEAEG